MGLIWAEARSYINSCSQKKNDDPGLIRNDLLEDIENVLADPHAFSLFQKSMLQVAKSLKLSNKDVASKKFLTRIVDEIYRFTTSFIRVYLKAYPMRLGVVRDQYPNKLLLSNGKGAILKLDHLNRSSHYYVCLDMSLVEGTAHVNKVIGITLDDLLQMPNELISESETWIEHESKKYRSKVKQIRFQEIILKETRLNDDDLNVQGNSLIRANILENPQGFLKNCSVLDSVLNGWKWWAMRSGVETLLPELFEFLIDEALKHNQEPSQLNYDQWIHIFYQLLDYNTVQKWQSECPYAINLPSGRKAFIKYGHQDQSPEMEVMLKDLYGLKHHPQVLNQPIRIIVLGPNRRPIQITQSIETFWKLSYFEIRKELKGRYPKQPWPDDPTVLPNKNK
jgi:ATP-dependent helicase HrpB